MRLVLVFLLLCSAAQAAHTEQKGKFKDVEKVASQSVQEHYRAAIDAHKERAWPELIKQSLIVLENFPKTPFAEDAQYYLGVGYFYTQELALANKNLSSYLKKSALPKHFEEAIEYKYSIAEQFRQGEKTHLLGLSFLPKWMPAKEGALQIYDEVIAALPHHDLAAKSLFGKASILFGAGEYKSSVETFQTLIRRFPKHRCSPESYIGIAEVYLTQCKKEYPDPDLLDLASINLRKFRADFPGDERLTIMDGLFLEMEEIYAASLFETGKFFEKTKKPKAAEIYYQKIIASYPTTKIAQQCREKIELMGKESGSEVR